MIFVDIHTHNYTKSDAIAIRNLTFSEAENLFSSDEDGLFSVGIHPWFAPEYFHEQIARMENWITSQHFFAVGECGLDKNSNVPLSLQQTVFELHIKLSEKYGKPLIVHCVGFFNELLEMKKRLSPCQLWIIHGFRGKPQLAQQLLHAGCTLSYGAYFNPQSVRITPSGKLFVETDESNLTIENIYQQIAVTKGCDVEELNAGANAIRMHKNAIIRAIEGASV
jgi:TatD DNase family protein